MTTVTRKQKKLEGIQSRGRSRGLQVRMAAKRLLTILSVAEKIPRGRSSRRSDASDVVHEQSHAVGEAVMIRKWEAFQF